MDLDCFAHRDHDKVKLAISDCIEKSAGAYVNTSHVITVVLTPEQLEQAKKAFSPQPVTYQPRVCLPHALAKHYTTVLEGQLKMATRGRPIIEAGPAPHQINSRPKDTHFCLVRGDARNHVRFATAPNSGLSRKVRRIYQGLQKEDASACLNGYQGCHQPRATTVAIHSTYDIPLKEFCQGMNNHKSDLAHVIMHMPSEITFPPGVFVNDMTGYRLDTTGPTARFTYLEDTSNGYDHSKSDWLEWTTVTALVVGGFTFHIEVQRRLGSVVYLIIYRSTLAVKITRPLDPLCTTSFVFDPYGPTSGHTAPTSYVRSLHSYACGLPDETFSYTRLVIYAKGLAFRAKIGNVALNEGWNPDTTAFSAVVAGVFMDVAVKRYLRSKGISHCMKELKKEQSAGFWTRLWQRICIWFGDDNEHRHMDHKTLKGWVSSGMIIDPACVVLQGTASLTLLSLTANQSGDFEIVGWLASSFEKFLDYPNLHHDYLRDLMPGFTADRAEHYENLLHTVLHTKERRGETDEEITNRISEYINVPYEEILSTVQCRLNLRSRLRVLPKSCLTTPIPTPIPTPASSRSGSPTRSRSSSISSSVISFHMGKEAEFDNKQLSLLDAPVDADLNLVQATFLQPTAPPGLQNTVVIGAQQQEQVATPALLVQPTVESSSTIAATSTARVVLPAKPISIDVTLNPSAATGAVPKTKSTPNQMTTPAVPPTAVPQPQVQNTVTPVPRVQLALAGVRYHNTSIFDTHCAIAVNPAHPTLKPGGGLSALFHRQFKDLEAKTAPHTTTFERLPPFAVSVKVNKVGNISEVVHAIGPDRGRGQTSYSSLLCTYQLAMQTAGGPTAFPLLGANIFGWSPEDSLRAFMEADTQEMHHLYIYDPSDPGRFKRLIGSNPPDGDSTPPPADSSVREINGTVAPEKTTLLETIGSSLGLAPSWYKPTTCRYDETACRAINSNMGMEKGKGGDSKIFAELVASAPLVTPFIVKYHLTEGVPGSGKSHAAKKLNKSTCVVVPTGELKNDWKQSGFRNTVTPHVAIKYGIKSKFLIIDEVFSIPPHLLAIILHKHKDNNILLGDSKQIAACDFDNFRNFDLITPAFVPSVYLNKTYRLPQDITRYLQRDYPGIHTTSKVSVSISYYPPPVGTQCQVVGYRQLIKEMPPWRKTANTSHELQGATRKAVHLHLLTGDVEMIRSSRSHTIVALSRHTDQIFITGDAESIQTLQLTDKMENIVINYAPTTIINDGSSLEIVNGPEDDSHVLAPAADSTAVGEILQQCTNHVYTPISAVVLDCERINQGSLTVKCAVPDERIIPKTNFTEIEHCRRANASSTWTTVRTLIGRYTKLTINPAHVHDTIQAVNKTFWSCLTIDQMNCLPTTAELAELVRSMKDKGADPTLIHDLDFNDISVTKMTFFQKECDKFTMDEPVQHNKPGQGISAWPKTLCFIYGLFFRKLEKELRQALKPNIVFSNPYTEDQLARAVSKCTTSTTIFYENDFSAFDSTQNLVSLGNEFLILIQCGMPPALAEVYFNLRFKWTLDARVASLRGTSKKHSGEPGTMLFNTIWNMTAVFHTTNFTRMTLALFKGDDSLVCCDSSTATPYAKEFVSQNGLVMKQKTSHLGSFTCSLVTRTCYVPDVIRFACRLNNKDFTDSKRIEDLQRATDDFIKRATVTNNYGSTCAINGRYYGVPSETIECVVGFLQDFALTGKIELQTAYKPILKY
nr:polyprotein [Cutthroat trout virus]